MKKRNTFVRARTTREEIQVTISNETACILRISLPNREQLSFYRQDSAKPRNTFGRTVYLDATDLP